MERRIDFSDDPAPNSLVPSVNVVTNEAGDILMIRRSDNGTWAVSGGVIDLGGPSRKPRYGRLSKRPECCAR